MKTFSRLSILFLGIVLMLVGNNADAQGPSLEVIGAHGFDGTARAGDTVSVTFKVGPVGVVPLNVDAKNINLTSHTGPGTYNTTPRGTLTVEGTLILAGVEAYITAEWEISGTEVLSAKAELEGRDPEYGPAIIVVNPPNPKDTLEVGDTFTQTITIENESSLPTLPLSAWQMDIVYNPSILAVVSVTEGDFLESNGDDTLFIANQSRGRISAGQVLAGQTAGVAMMPSPPGISLAPGDSGNLLTVEFTLLAYAEEALGIHNTLLQSDQDEDGDGTPDRISYSIKVKDVAVATMHETYIYAKEDVNQDEMVNIHDLMVVAASVGTLNPRADINGDGFVNVLDLVLIYTSDLWAKPAPKTLDQSFSRAANAPAPTINGKLDSTTIQSWIDQAQVTDDGSEIFQRGISNLETLLNSKVPTKTRLLLNYPNPFNPETWIPYQLAEPTNVTVTIHAMNGSLIRTLNLGHQSAGSYISKSQAAYWDGRNEFGEHSASGLYFYTFTAGKYSATGKMLILK